MPDSETFSVAPNEAGAPLIGFLAAHLDLSKKNTKRLLDAHAVFVNDRRVWMAKHALRPGDHVEVRLPREAPASRPARSPTLLWQDDDYVIADKPAGLLSNGPDSLESELREALHCPALEAVHRLDRDTSGCLLLAKNRAARDAMVQVFKEGRITKLYHALALGRVSHKAREIATPVDGEPALTRLTVLSSNHAASHLKLKLETGRTHQIRKHLLVIRHPVLGDRSYAAGAEPLAALRGIPRQMLHASGLAFRHPRTGEMVRVQSPLPGDFRVCMRKLRLT